MRDSTALPDLRILPTNKLLPHEDFDPRRVETLSQRIWQDGILKHPPIVTSIPESDQYVILDGANRCLALAHMSVPHIVAQHISYGDPGVELDTWYHVICNMPGEQFEFALAAIPGLKLIPSSLEQARAALSLEQACAYINGPSGVRLAAKTDHSCQVISLLKDIVSAYKGKADIYRASNDVWEKQAPYYPGITAIIVFPRLLPADILHAVRNGDQVPSGLTRHIIPNRAVNINFPLHVLASNWQLERKSEWLQGWLMGKMAKNTVRFYSESTFSFDE
jgi:hypothetical protein